MTYFLSMIKISTEQRDTLSAIARIAFNNPFAEERRKKNLDSLRVTIKNPPNDEAASWLKDAVHRFLGQLDEQFACKLKLDDFTVSGELSRDGELFRQAVLLDIYLQTIGTFDNYINDAHEKAPWEKKGDAVAQTKFADQTMGELVSRGFKEIYKEKDILKNRDAHHQFALFYQRRRAYHLINEAIIGESVPIKTLREKIWQNIFTVTYKNYENRLFERMEDFTTVILGDTGTGKGMVAQCIGKSSYIPFDPKEKWFKHKFEDIFVSINLSQYAEDLIESELFGYEEGAFTGTRKGGHKGVLERCDDHGYIFMDEIGDVKKDVQVKLLKVIQERRFYRVGGEKQLEFRGQIIVATNKDIHKMMQEGQFRKDFYYRLCTDIIRIPSLYECLKDNPDDLKRLIKKEVQDVLQLQTEDDDEIKTEADKIYKIIAPQAKGYEWPGNVRELEQAVRRSMLHNTFERTDTSSAKLSGSLPQFIEDMLLCKLCAEEVLSGYATYLLKEHGKYSEVAKAMKCDHRTVKKLLGITANNPS